MDNKKNGQVGNEFLEKIRPMVEGMSAGKTVEMYELIAFLRKEYNFLEELQGKMLPEKFAILAVASRFLKEEINQNFGLKEPVHGIKPELIKEQLRIITMCLGIFLENAFYKNKTDWLDYYTVEITYFTLVNELNRRPAPGHGGSGGGGGG